MRAIAHRPDAVIVDLGLPSIEDGCALLRQIRQLPGGDAILILVVTGHGREADRRRALEAGGDLFFVKPPNLDKVREDLQIIGAHRERAIRAGQR